MTQSSDRDPDRSIFKKEVLGDGRLAALRRYDILDTPPEESFDRLTELAGAAFDVEVAFLAFLTSDRQWFKSSVGLDRTESSLAASFCTYTVEREDLFVIEDAREEERMAQSPFVTEVGLRFYAGVPVMTPDGYAIGTFSIMDSEPQSLSDKKKQRLRSLAQMATEELERRREAQEQKQIARRFTAVFEDPNVCGAVLSPDGTLTEINETFLNRVSEDREKVIGRPFWTLSWWSDERQEDVRTWIRRASTRDYIDFEADVTGPSGACYNVEGTIRPVTDDDETVTSLVVSARDVTARREHERELRLFKSAVEQAGESILITEAEPIEKPGPRIEYVNAAFEDMTGYREEEIRSKTPRILQGPETNRTVLDGLRAALEAGVSWEGETTNYRKDGTPYIVRWSISPVRGGEIRSNTGSRCSKTSLRSERVRRLFGTREIFLSRLSAWRAPGRSTFVLRRSRARRRSLTFSRCRPKPSLIWRMFCSFILPRPVLPSRTRSGGA